jgi:hypothetical protein
VEGPQGGRSSGRRRWPGRQRNRRQDRVAFPWGQGRRGGRSGRAGRGGLITREVVRLIGRSARRRFWVVGFLILLAGAAFASGPALLRAAADAWGPSVSYFDNGRQFTVKVHDLPLPGPSIAADANRVWPETILRSVCHYTLSLMGLSGPEGTLWEANLEKTSSGEVLVIRAPGGNVVGRYRVTEGSEDAGLAVVELDAGLNGLHLMSVQAPVANGGWLVIHTYRVPD